MKKSINSLDQYSNTNQTTREETIAYSISREPFFRWVLRHPMQLNTALLNGLLANLEILKEPGKQYMRELLTFLPAQYQKKAELFLTDSLNSLPPSPLEYSELVQHGYTGETMSGSPAGAVKKRLQCIMLKNRGIEVTPKGKLIFNANVFAKYVLERIQLIYFNEKESYVYKAHGRYELVSHDLLKKYCREFLHEARDNIWTSKWENEYFTAIKREMLFVSKMNPDSKLINLNNGVLDLRTMKLNKHSSKYLSTIQIHIDYDSAATSPKFYEFLKEIFEEDQERIDLIQELLGYCFMPEVKIQKAFIFLGNGSNGKSVLAEIIRNLLGSENVSNVALSNIAGQFGLQNLPGKLANISSENEFDKKFNTQNFKMLTSGDAVNVEMKYRDSFNTQLTATIIILLNKLMDSDDHSQGYYRRLTIIPFNKEFKELNANEIEQIGVNYMDKDLTTKLIGELPGILNFALEGLQRLIQNNFNMTRSTVVDQALLDYKNKQNPVIEFYQQMIEVDADSKVKRSDILKNFHLWAIENGLDEYSKMGSTKFWEKFRKVLTDNEHITNEKKINGIVYTNGIKLAHLDSKGYVQPIQRF